MATDDFDGSQVDALHGEAKFDEIWKIVTEAYTKDESNVELLWRYARACYDRQEAASDKKEKEKLSRKGLELTDQAIALDAAHPDPHKWRGILLAEVGNYTDTKTKIGNSYQIKEELELALKARPNDSSTLYALGKWCEAVAGVGWIQRKLAATLFKTPPESSYEEAIEFYQKAWDAQKDPPHKRAALAMGECYHALKNKEKRREWMQKCVDVPAVSDVEKQLDMQAKKYL